MSRLLVASLLASLLAGCASARPWHVVEQATPNPFVDNRFFLLLYTDFSDLHIGKKTEEEYLADKDEEQQRRITEAKAVFLEAFTRSLIERARKDSIQIVLSRDPKGTGPFLIIPKVTFFEPGFYVDAVSGVSRLDMMVRLTLPYGQFLDEIRLSRKSAAPATNRGAPGAPLDVDTMSVGGRIRADAEWMGEKVAEYVASRVFP